MNELIAQTGAILGQATELLKIPAIGGAVTGLFGWLGKVFTKKSSKERLTLIEQNKHSEETIKVLKNNLQFEIEDNEELQAQLAQKLKEIEKLMKQEGVNTVKKTNTMNVTGNGNINFQDINLKGGNISVNR